MFFLNVFIQCIVYDASSGGRHDTIRSKVNVIVLISVFMSHVSMMYHFLLLKFVFPYLYVSFHRRRKLR